MVELDHLSYSSIHSYQMCPRGWKYHYVDKLPTKTGTALVFGSAFHEAAEDYVRQRAISDELVPEPLCTYWRRHWSKQLEKNGIDNIDWRDETPESMEKLGISILSSPEVIETLNGLAPLVTGDHIHIEDYITLNVPGVPIPVVGYIDIITADGVAGDFKTSSRKWYASRADGEQQAAFYLAALNQAGSPLQADNPFRYYVFTKTKKPAAQTIETTRTPGELLWLLDMIRSVWEAIDAGAFPMNPDTWKCSPKWCEYWPICRGKYE